VRRSLRRTLTGDNCEAQKKMQIVEGEKYKDMLQRHIRRAIDSGRGIDERDGDGRTALHWAAANGHQVL
jgi:ankyrin repeat protein